MKKFFKFGCLGIIVLIILIIVIVAVSGGDDENSSSDDKKTETKAEKPAKSFAVGDEVKVEDLSFTVNKVEETNELKMEYMDSLTTEGKFIVVDLTVGNNDKKARMIDSEMFRIIGSDGTEYKASSDADMYINDNDLGFFLQEVNPKMTLKGSIAFELPKDETGYSLQVSSGLGWSGGKYQTIKLGK